jgi:hypothetical protein
MTVAGAPVLVLVSRADPVSCRRFQLFEADEVDVGKNGPDLGQGDFPKSSERMIALRARFW